MKNLFIGFFFIVFADALFAQTPNIVRDTLSNSTCDYKYNGLGQLDGVTTHFYVKNIGSPGVINVTVTAGSYIENTSFTVGSNARYELVSVVSVGEQPNVTKRDLTISASFPGAPGVTSTYPVSNFSRRSPMGYYQWINPTAYSTPSSTLGLVTEVKGNQTQIPTRFTLEQNYPNPCNPATTISFSLPSQSFVSLKVFDALGREVSAIVSEELSAGPYVRRWNADGLPSGVYFYRLEAGSFVETKKLVLVR